jgi:hypothetical protein
MSCSQWHQQTASIHASFFPSGKYTHLWIDPSVSDGKLKWKYWFMDLGMCHVMESDELISEIDGSKERVFRGRYHAFVRALHADLIGKDCLCSACGD